jgi:UDP-glucose 4-epimerase
METFRALVTGGLGLIGSSLVSNLLKSGNELVVIDNGSAFDYNLFQKLSSQISEDVTLIKSDTEDQKLLDLLKHENFDFIFNFGSYSSDRYYEKNDIDAVNRTINGMLNIFKLAKITKASRIIYPSSGTVYGNNHSPQGEGINLMPQTLYSITKIYLELLSKINKEIESVGLRIFTGYGSREWYKGDLSSVVSLFTTSAIEKKSIEIYGDGNQRRDFIESDDIAEIAVRLAKDETPPSIVNCGSGESNSFNELIDLISKSVDGKLDVRYVKSKTKFVAETKANIDLMLNHTKFKPKRLNEIFPHYFKELKMLMEE